MRFHALWMAAAVAIFSAASSSPRAAGDLQIPLKEKLGKSIFFDQNLSEPRGQSCASCHDPGRAFTDPRPGPTSEGVIPGRFGPRNAPSAMYNAAFAPPLMPDGDDGGLTSQEIDDIIAYLATLTDGWTPP